MWVTAAAHHRASRHASREESVCIPVQPARADFGLKLDRARRRELDDVPRDKYRVRPRPLPLPS